MIHATYGGRADARWDGPAFGAASPVQHRAAAVRGRFADGYRAALLPADQAAMLLRVLVSRTRRRSAAQTTAGRVAPPASAHLARRVSGASGDQRSAARRCWAATDPGLVRRCCWRRSLPAALRRRWSSRRSCCAAPRRWGALDVVGGADFGAAAAGHPGPGRHGRFGRPDLSGLAAMARSAPSLRAVGVGDSQRWWYVAGSVVGAAGRPLVAG